MRKLEKEKAKADDRYYIVSARIYRRKRISMLKAMVPAEIRRYGIDATRENLRTKVKDIKLTETEISYILGEIRTF